MAPFVSWRRILEKDSGTGVDAVIDGADSVVEVHTVALRKEIESSVRGQIEERAKRLSQAQRSEEVWRWGAIGDLIGLVLGVVIGITWRSESDAARIQFAQATSR